MSVFCNAPDASQGIALRLSDYVSCEARALGENGFQALAGGPLGTSLLSGLVTIFIALIGYRLILGHTPDMRDGIGWTVRLGIVLALVTSWPAFQTLVYRVAVDGPGELASVLLPASGLPSTDLSGRVQSAYDTIRLGTTETVAPPSSGPVPNPNGPPAEGQLFKFQSPLPNTASLLVISTSGVIAALQIAIGFLLAVGPIALMSLLFDGTSSLFNGWLRALAGAALTVLGATVVTAIDLVMVESELGRLEMFRLRAAPMVIDPQALTTIVALFAFVMIIMLFATMRMAGALKLPSRWGSSLGAAVVPARAETPLWSNARGPLAAFTSEPKSAAVQSRVAAVAEIFWRGLLSANSRFYRNQRRGRPRVTPELPTRQSVPLTPDLVLDLDWVLGRRGARAAPREGINERDREERLF